MKPRRWFRFSLRTLLVLVALVGLALAWLGVQVKWIRDRHEAANWLFHGRNSRLEFRDYRTAPWGIRMLGETGYKEVYVWVHDREDATDEDRQIKQQAELLFPEAKVEFKGFSQHGMSFGGFGS